MLCAATAVQIVLWTAWQYGKTGPVLKSLQLLHMQEAGGEEKANFVSEVC